MDKQQLDEELKAWKARLDRGEITEAAYDKAIEPILEALNEPYAQAAKKAADAPTEMGLLPEQVVGDAHHQFKLEERLGEGGMGQVWKAEDLDCKQDWSNHDCYRALKFPPTVWLSDETAKKNLKREANAAKLLDCPHTVKVYGWHEQQRGNNLPSQVFIEMEYLEGKSFAQHLKDDWKDGLPFQRVMELIEPVAQSLDCAHQKNINHRDIKPANLFLIEAGEVKVLDFGIADEYRKTDASLGTKLKEQKYRSSGTPGYMAPEVSTRKPEPRQDIHALACVIYELLTGEPAFTITPDTPRHPHFYPEPPKSLTEAAWEVLKNGFAFEAEKRPASAGELVESLCQAQTELELESKDETETQQSEAEEPKPPRPGTDNPQPFAWGKALVTLFVVLLSGTGLFGWQQGWFDDTRTELESDQVSSNQAEKASPQNKPAKVSGSTALPQPQEKDAQAIPPEAITAFDKAFKLQFQHGDYIAANAAYEQAAQQGHPLAMGMLAVNYARGRGVAKDKDKSDYWYKRFVQTIDTFKMDDVALINYVKAKVKIFVEEDYPSGIALLEKAIDAENIHAMKLLGWMYSKGRGVPQDDKKAVEWYRKAADKGEIAAMNNLGWKYAEGQGVPQDDKKAVEWYRKAAEKGDTWAMNNLGWMYQEGRGVPQDDKKAVEWYRKAADKGHVTAMWRLGWMYAEGRGVPQDDKKAVEWYRKAAKKGNTAAMNNLGWMYEKGRGIPQDDKKAVELYRKAVEKGDAEAMRKLGWMYAEGRGVPQDDKKAVEWYRKAAEKGNATAMENLGWMYKKGLGVLQDDNKAVEWFRKATKKGNEWAMNDLGWMYKEGRGVPQDDKKAVEWFRKAAGKGNAEAMRSLGWMYAEGRGVPQDDKKAVEWFRKAAGKGNKWAMSNLGWMYEKGRGVPQDDKKAMEWYRKAARLGHAKAKAALERLKNKQKGTGVFGSGGTSVAPIRDNQPMPQRPEMRDPEGMNVLEWSE